MRTILSLLLLIGAFGLGASAADAEPGAAASLDDLAWMTGYWVGEGSEEFWTAPAGGMLVGIHRDVFPNGKSFFEYLRIEADSAGIVYQASPRGSEPVPFRLKSWSKQRVSFENLRHDYPHRIIYWLDADGALHSRVEGMRQGKRRSSEWAWRRSDIPSPGSR